MLVPARPVAHHTKVEVVTDNAMVARLDPLCTAVAVVLEFVLILGEQLVEHHQGGELGAPQRGELKMAVTTHGQEGIAPIHQATLVVPLQLR